MSYCDETRYMKISLSNYLCSPCIRVVERWNNKWVIHKAMEEWMTEMRRSENGELGWTKEQVMRLAQIRALLSSNSHALCPRKDTYSLRSFLNHDLTNSTYIIVHALCLAHYCTTGGKIVSTYLSVLLLPTSVPQLLA